MRPRRTPAYPNTADADAFSTDLSDLSDVPDITDPDAPRASSRLGRLSEGPLVVCLACGSAPGSRSECPHDEVARVDSASAPLRAAAERLAHAMQEKRALERALRKLISAEVSDGSATLDVTPPQPPVVVQLPPVSLVCPKCSQETPVATTTQTAQATQGAHRPKPRRISADQGFFGFAAPPPEPEALPPPEAPVAPVVENTPEPEAQEAPARAKRGRKKKAVEALGEPQSG